jgi:hypothetical protein
MLFGVVVAVPVASSGFDLVVDGANGTLVDSSCGPHCAEALAVLSRDCSRVAAMSRRGSTFASDLLLRNQAAWQALVEEVSNAA